MEKVSEAELICTKGKHVVVEIEETIEKPSPRPGTRSTTLGRASR